MLADVLLNAVYGEALCRLGLQRFWGFLMITMRGTDVVDQFMISCHDIN